MEGAESAMHAQLTRVLPWLEGRHEYANSHIPQYQYDTYLLVVQQSIPTSTAFWHCAIAFSPTSRASAASAAVSM